MPGGLPSFRVLFGCLTHAAAANEVHDRKQDNGAKQRPEEGFYRQALVDVALAEHKAREDSTDDANDDVHEDTLLGIGPHDQAGKPTNDAADNEPNDNTHLRSLLFWSPRKRGVPHGITDA